jgi:hypothetical protein
MLTGTGLEFVARGTAGVLNEFPETDLAVRAPAAARPSRPALGGAGYDRFAAARSDALAPLYAEGPGVRIRSEFG